MKVTLQCDVDEALALVMNSFGLGVKPIAVPTRHAVSPQVLRPRPWHLFRQPFGSLQSLVLLQQGAPFFSCSNTRRLERTPASPETGQNGMTQSLGHELSAKRPIGTG